MLAFNTLVYLYEKQTYSDIHYMGQAVIFPTNSRTLFTGKSCRKFETLYHFETLLIAQTGFWKVCYHFPEDLQKLALRLFQLVN
jgi:hypothetical protein